MKLTGQTLFLAGVVAVLLWIGYAARAVVTPLLAALLLAYILDPVVRSLQRIGLSRSVASAVTVVVAFAAILGGVTLTAARIATEATTFYRDVAGEPAVDAVTKEGTPVTENEAVLVLEKDVRSPEDKIRAGDWFGRKLWYVDRDRDQSYTPGYLRQGFAKLRRDLAANEMTKAVSERLNATEEIGGAVATSAGRWLSGLVDAGRTAADTVLGILTLLVLFPIYLYYSLAQLSWVYEVSVRHLPAAHRERVVQILDRIHVTLSAFFRGRLILLAIRFVVLLATFVGFGVPFGVVCAVFGAVVSLVPVVGPVAGSAVPLLLSVASGASSATTLSMAGVLVALEVADNYVLTPAILGKRVGLHPLTILVATFVAGDLMGLFGMLVAIPLAAVLKILAIEFVLPEVRKQAGLPPGPDPT